MTAHRHADYGGLPLAALDAHRAALVAFASTLDATTRQRVRVFRHAYRRWVATGSDDWAETAAQTKRELIAGRADGRELVQLALSGAGVTP